MRFVFRLCKDLGIDDPIAWMNAAPAVVVDRWVAFYRLEQSDSDSEMMDPSEAFTQLSGRHGR